MTWISQTRWNKTDERMFDPVSILSCWLYADFFFSCKNFHNCTCWSISPQESILSPANGFTGLLMDFSFSSLSFMCICPSWCPGYLDQVVGLLPDSSKCPIGRWTIWLMTAFLDSWRRPNISCFSNSHSRQIQLFIPVKYSGIALLHKRPHPRNRRGSLGGFYIRDITNAV